MNKVIYPILFALILLLPGSAFASTTDLKVFVTSDTVHEMQIKATQMVNGQILPASNFAVSPESVVQVNQGKNLLVFTDTNQPEKIEKVKVVDAKGVTTDLHPLPQSNQYLISAPPGVYTLNVIADNGNGKTAYETILIVLAPNQKPIQQSEITKIVQKYKLIVEIDFSEDKCSNKAGSANMGFPYQTVSECEVEQRDECERTGDDSSYCEGKRERFRDDCEGFKTKEECDKYWETPPGDICLTSFGPPPMCNPEPEPPACDENTPPNTLCRDEGDPDTCEDGFVDRGSGCVREEEDEDGEDAEDSIPPSDEREGNEFFDGGGSEGGGSEGGGSEDLEEGGNEDQEASSDEGDSQFG